MQQTEHYKLNLVEPGDVFSPDPLNQNMEKVEAALDAARAEAKAGDGALDQRMQVLEAHKVAAGTYIGDGTTSTGQFINLGFTPRVVIVQRMNSQVSMAVPGRPFGVVTLVVVENGFTASDTVNTSLNASGLTYAYLAIL